MPKKKPQKNGKTTTIKIRRETKARLDHLKEFERESYDEIIKKTLFVLNNLRGSPESAQGILRSIDAKIKRKHQVSSGIPVEKPEEKSQAQSKPVEKTIPKPPQERKILENKFRKIVRN